MEQTQILSGRQQEELHKAILQYLENILKDDDSQVLAKLKKKFDIPSDKQDEEIIPNYLEKKWSTVLRLQKRVYELQKELNNLRSIFDSQGSNVWNGSSANKSRADWLPHLNMKTFMTKSDQLIQCVSIHPVLPIIMAGCSDGSLIIWNLLNDEQLIPDKIIKAHTRPITKISWSKYPVDLQDNYTKNEPVAKHYICATASSDLTIKIWEGGNFKQLRTLTGHEHTISSLCFSASKPGILYSVSRDMSTKVWNLNNGFCVRTFVGHSEWVRDIDSISRNEALLPYNEPLSSDLGDFLLTCSNDQSIRLSHAESGTGLALLIGHTHVIECVKFLPQHSNHFIDNYLKENASLFTNLSLDIINDTRYEQELGYKYCISGGRDNSIKLWLLPLPVLRAQRHPLPSQVNNSHGWLVAELSGHKSWVKSLAVHPNGRFVFSCSDDKEIRIWDLQTLPKYESVRCTEVLKGHEGFVTDISFAGYDRSTGNEPIHHDGSEYDYTKQLEYLEKKIRCLFISGAMDSTVRLWS